MGRSAGWSDGPLRATWGRRGLALLPRSIREARRAIVAIAPATRDVRNDNRYLMLGSTPGTAGCNIRRRSRDRSKPDSHTWFEFGEPFFPPFVLFREGLHVRVCRVEERW